MSIRQTDQVSLLSLGDTVVKSSQNTTYIGKMVSCLTRNFQRRDPEKVSNKKQTIIQGWVVWENDSSHIQRHYQRDEHDIGDQRIQATRESQVSIPMDTLQALHFAPFLQLVYH